MNWSLIFKEPAFEGEKGRYMENYLSPSNFHYSRHRRSYTYANLNPFDEGKFYKMLKRVFVKAFQSTYMYSWNICYQHSIVRIRSWYSGSLLRWMQALVHVISVRYSAHVRCATGKSNNTGGGSSTTECSRQKCKFPLFCLRIYESKEVLLSYMNILLFFGTSSVFLFEYLMTCAATVDAPTWCLWEGRNGPRMN